MVRHEMYKGLSLRVLWALCIISISFTEAVEAQRVAVVLSAEIRPYVEALEGLREGLDHPVTIYELAANPELVRHRLEHETFDLVVAIGPQAAKLVWSHATPGGRMVLMVLDPERLLGPPTLCGVDLRVRMEEQVRLIVEHLGPGRRVGILYNPKESESWVAEAARAADAQDLTVVPLPVHERGEVLPALSRSYGTIDTLLFIPDPTVISETLLVHLVKKALLNGVAVMGYNHYFLEIGAVLALTVDYRGVGVLGAQLVGDMLAGRPCRLEPAPYKIEHNERALRLWQKTLPLRRKVGNEN